MIKKEKDSELFSRFVVSGNHAKSDYLGLINELIVRGKRRDDIDEVYSLLLDEIITNKDKPVQTISFGTSGWRGKLGKDIFVKSVSQVTRAIVQMYEVVEEGSELAALLGVSSNEEAKKRGCVLGFDNRFGGELLAAQVGKVLVESGFQVYYAGESATGVLSAAVLQYKSAFSINLTPSHNPLDYGGYKFNGADGGPAASAVTEQITANARSIVEADNRAKVEPLWNITQLLADKNVQQLDSLGCWKELVQQGGDVHGLSLKTSVDKFLERTDIFVAVDCVHGASRLHIKSIFNNSDSEKLHILRDLPDVTFGGVAPEPSSANMEQIVSLLGERDERLKLGAIIDPDGDRIRFTDGETEISMNQFGAMAYHFLHEEKHKKGMVAKTVATSNLANSLAAAFDEELFEPSVGFKNFKPVIGKALVIFEESDGISIIGHTPEKDAYIGLLLALEMLLVTDINLGQYLEKIESQYGAYYPDRDGVVVAIQGDELLEKLVLLEKYGAGAEVKVGEKYMKIDHVISIDGRKMVMEDGSWLMIRPSGTEPKVRFYVESRTSTGTAELVRAAKGMLKEIGLL
ncbi:MAG: phosphoglucomutase [Desulfobulbaceae bacterium]|nr:phosphoglucomutase [Desulfobulbaceae bacterium]